MKHLFPFILLLLVQSIFAQSNLPVIKATSRKVAINDGGYLDKNAWSLSPKIRPDVFTADRTRKTKWVTFYTDIDSIKVKVKPGTRFNFVVLLNGKDSCFTQITSAIAPVTTTPVQTQDSIPFTLTAFNAIMVRAVINNTDNLDLHFDTGSFGFSLTRDAILKKTALLSNQPNALAGKAKPDYNHLNKVVQLQMGKMIWRNPDIGTTRVTAHDMDGKFGYALFESKIVEINYDQNVLVIHSKLPGHLKGYRKSKLEFIHSFVCIKGSIEKEGKNYTGTFLMDTGSDQAMIADSAWAAKYDFVTGLKLIKTTALYDPRGVKYESSIVQSPSFKVNTFKLANIPTLVLGGKNPTGFSINYLGNALLKRFNIILDFQTDCLYLKPNKLMNVTYGENG